MAKRGNPDLMVSSITFSDESPAGIMLIGNDMTIMPYPILWGAYTWGAPQPILARLDHDWHRVAREPHRGEFKLIDRDQRLCFWRLTLLADGDYHLESTYRYGDSVLLRSLIGEVKFRVEAGCLAEIYLTKLPVIAGTTVDPFLLEAAKRTAANPPRRPE